MRNPVRGPGLREGVLPVLNPPGPPVLPGLPSREHSTYPRIRTTGESTRAAAGNRWVAVPSDLSDTMVADRRLRACR